MKNRQITIAILFLVAIAGIALSYFDLSRLTKASGENTEISALNKPKKTLRPFKSEKELQDFFKARAERDRRESQATGNAMANSSSGAVTNAPTPAAKTESVDGAKDDSITNNQHAGVDEGDIVKLHGDHLVILRRGRLFTVRIGDDSLKPIAAVDAYPPGIDPRNDWYDEMLVSDNTVVVIGYSYGRGGTEINLFDINNDGRLAYRATYHLRSNDYYSSRNYASRLIGSKLVFYTPQYLGYYGDDPTQQFPAIRKWHKGATNDEFKKVVSATNVYRVERPITSSYGLALHTVTVCDLADRNFACTGTAVVGAPGRVFYVSQDSVYVWTTDWSYNNSKSRENSMLYKMPLDGSAPSALGVNGTPVDQFSFLEDSDNHLNVLVRSDGYGDGMWGAEFASGDVALFRTSIDDFSDGSTSASLDAYRKLPKVEGYTFQNRFVGNYVLYGTGSGWGRPEQRDEANLFALNYTTGELNQLKLSHGVDRIEQMGKDAVVVGTNGSDLYFTPVSLGDTAEVKKSFVRKGASQGELRSHGFFYKPDGENSGVIGLPIAREGRAGYRHLIENSAAIIFLRNRDLQLEPLGELGSQTANMDDNCKASCVDWYGNARPIFIHGRVFALLGYELVEGSLNRNGIDERRRVNFSKRYVPLVSSE